MKAAVASVLLSMLLVALAPSATLAKVPWSSVEIEPDQPVAGEQFAVSVRFFGDARHSRRVDGMPERISLELQGPGGDTPVRFDQVGDATFSAEITLSEGSWRLVAAHDFGEVDGETGVEIAMVTVAASPTAAAPIGAAVIGVALVALGTLWRTRRSAAPS